MSLPRPASWLSALLLATACASDPSASDAAMSAGHGSAREAITAAIEAIVAGGRFDGELWRLNLSERCQGEVVAVGTCVDGDSILVEDGGRQLHSIDRARGVHRFIVALPGRITQTVGGTSDAISAVCTDDIVAVSRKHGARVMPRPSNHLEFFPSGRAVTVGDSAYVGRLAPYSLQALDLSGGRSGWAYPTSGPVIDVLSYGDGTLAQVIGATEDGLVFSLPSRPAVASAWAPPENWHLRLPAARITTPARASSSAPTTASSTISTCAAGRSAGRSAAATTCAAARRRSRAARSTSAATTGCTPSTSSRAASSGPPAARA
jgi:hypothetical protein